MNKKVLFVLFAILMMAVMTVSVSADQDGHTNWCNMDQYGCWVTGDEGQQNYIMFWSESARQYFMGNSTAPYTNVVDFCADCNGKLGLEENKTAKPSITEMANALLKYYENTKQYADFVKWMGTATDSEIERNYYGILK